MPKIVELHRAESTRSIHLYKTFFVGEVEKASYIGNDAFCSISNSTMAIFWRAWQPYTIKLG